MNKNALSLFLGKKGASLLQVLLGSSAVAGMALIGIELSKDQKRLADKTTALYEMKYIEDEITFLLEKKKNCWANFGNYLLSGDSDKSTDYLVVMDKDEATNRDKQYVRMKTLEAGGILLGQDNIYIESYETSTPEYIDNSDKGSFKLRVNLVHKSKEGAEEKYQRSIPIYFSVFPARGAGECSSYQDREVLTKDWFTGTDGGMNYNAGKLSIGTAVSLAEVNIFGGLIIRRGELTQCRARDIGVIRYMEEGKNFEICDGLNWVVLGEGSSRFTDNQIYKFDTKSGLSTTSRIKAHRICSLTRVRKTDSQSRCKLSRNTSEPMSGYEISLTKVKKGSELDCEVWCYD